MWEGALKLASTTLPESLELLLTLPDAAVERLFKGFTPTAEAAAAVSVPVPAKASAPLLLCRSAVVAFVTAQPYRVRPLLRARVLGGEETEGPAQSMPGPPLPHGRVLPPPGQPLAPQPPRAASGWSSSTLRPPPPAPLLSAQPPFLPHPAGAAATAFHPSAVPLPGPAYYGGPPPPQLPAPAPASSAPPPPSASGWKSVRIVDERVTRR